MFDAIVQSGAFEGRVVAPAVEPDVRVLFDKYAFADVRVQADEVSDVASVVTHRLEEKLVGERAAVLAEVMQGDPGAFAAADGLADAGSGVGVAVGIGVRVRGGGPAGSEGCARALPCADTP